MSGRDFPTPPSPHAGVVGMLVAGGWPVMWQYDFLVRVAGSKEDVSTLEALGEEVEESGAMALDEKACLRSRIRGVLDRLAGSASAAVKN